MTIPVPDVLTSDNSAEYIMSIRLSPDGLSFCGYRPEVDGSFFYREARFGGSLPYAVELKNCFFENECLSWSYGRTRLICISRYTLVPEAFYDEERKGEWFDLCQMKTGGHLLSNSIKEAKTRLVYSIDESVWSFCSRSFARAEFTHYLVALLDMWLHDSRSHENARQMYVVVEGKRMDIACFDREELLFLNTFTVPDWNSQLYYILYVWKRLGLSAERDQLSFYANSPIRASLLDRLKIYLREVRFMEVPPEVYTRGTDLFKAPVDIIAFSL